MRPIDRLSVFAAAAFAAANLVAQTQVIPAAFATTDAGSSTAWPFGLGTTCRIQYVYGAAETGITVPTLIRSINLRANNASTNVAKSGIDLQVSMSTTPVAVGTASTTFANNHGANLSVAYTRKLTNIAATTPTTPNIGQYAGALTLDVPFLYDPAAGNLIIDFDISAHITGAWSHDTPFTTAGTHTSVGTACGTLVAGSTGGAIGGAYVPSVSGGVANSPAVLIIGSTLFPNPIPVPGNPACFLYHDFAATLPLTLSGTGGATLPLTVPPQSSLRGSSLLTQWAAVNASALIETSVARQTTFASWNVLRVYNNTSNTSATGTIQNYVGIVIELGL